MGAAVLLRQGRRAKTGRSVRWAVAGIPIGAPVDRVSISSLIVPFVWAAFVIWALADRKLLRVVVSLAGALVASSAAIALGLPACSILSGLRK